MLNKLAYGALVMVIGLFIVFLGLTILIGCCTVMGLIFKSITNKQQAKAAAAKAAAAPAPVAAPVEQPAPAEETVVEDDPQLIAVIAAAIAAYDNSNKTLVVRKVRRVAGWNSAARQENVYRF